VTRVVDERFGAVLRQFRTEAGLTQEGLAERAGLSARTVQKLERGESAPYPATFRRIAQALRLSPDSRDLLQSLLRPQSIRGSGPPDTVRRTPVLGHAQEVHPEPALPDRRGGRRATSKNTEKDSRFVVESPERLRLVPLADEWVAFVPIARAPQYAGLLGEMASMAAAHGDSGVMGAIGNRIGYCHLAEGDLRQARADFEGAVGQGKRGGSSLEMALSHVLLQWTRLCAGDFDQVLLCHEQTLAALDEVSDARLRCWGMAPAALAAAFLGQVDVARGIAGDARARADASGDPDSVALAISVDAMVRTAGGDPRTGVDVASAASSITCGPAVGIWVDAARGWSMARAATAGDGSADDARSLFEALLGRVRALGVGPAEVATMLFLGESYRGAGQSAAGRSMTEAMVARAEVAGMRFPLAIGRRLLGEIALDDEPGATARAAAAGQLDASIELLRHMRAGPELALAISVRDRLARTS